MGIAALILYVPRGDVVLNGLVQGVQNVIDYANVGIRFLFGPLSEREEMGFIFAIHVLPVIVFFASLMATLYYLGIMQRVVSFLGGLLHRLLKTSRTESMSAVANIFMGHTEAPLVVRPYLAATTNSELFAIMTVGMATIAGAVMAGFATMGVSLKYLITASFMGAPGGLLMAKILVPETDYRDPQLVHVQYSDDAKPVNIFEAAANGARDGLMLALNIGAMLLAFIALIALVNGMIGGIGRLLRPRGPDLPGHSRLPARAARLPARGPVERGGRRRQPDRPEVRGQRVRRLRELRRDQGAALEPHAGRHDIRALRLCEPVLDRDDARRPRQPGARATTPTSRGWDSRPLLPARLPA